MNTWVMDGRMDGMDGWVDGMDGRNGWMNGHLDGRVDGYIDALMGGSMDGMMDGWMDGCVDILMDGWMDGLLNPVPRRGNEEDRTESGKAVRRHGRRGRGVREGGDIARVLQGLLGPPHGPRPPQPQAGW